MMLSDVDVVLSHFQALSMTLVFGTRYRSLCVHCTVHAEFRHFPSLLAVNPSRGADILADVIGLVLN